MCNIAKWSVAVGLGTIVIALGRITGPCQTVEVGPAVIELSAEYLTAVNRPRQVVQGTDIGCDRGVLQVTGVCRPTDLGIEVHKHFGTRLHALVVVATEFES